ncbi:MAG: hypothetical protein E7604_11755 [Ruminococcaceae bacterium]|nr:hypothetical protein [Oscillospiraceae bacterium]
MEPAAEDAALLTESASEAPEADTETVSEGSDAPKKGTRPKRSRGRRGGRNRHGKGGDRVPDNTPAAEEDFDAEDAESASEIIYEPTERDEIAAEVHELISEERLAALAEDDAENPEDDEAADESEADGDAEPESAVKSPVEIVGIRFKPAGKVYYFDPDGAIYRENDEVIVETARGIEFGFVVTANRTVIASDIVSPLKKILRMATEEDRAHYEENNRRRDEAFAVCREKIMEHGIDMKLIDVEYTFDNNKLLFYFTADGRVDFRELVKDLASVFRTRIELRQIGIRDEAKLMGGLGVCGRPFCCHSFLSDFVQVSIKMAKEQNLSLNSAKISGTCGRLMCCLRYEYDVYEEEIRKTPKMDAVVETPDGEAVVCEVIPLAGLVRVKFMGNRSDMPPKLFHRDDVRVKGKMNWKSGTVTYLEEQK